jgi:transposase
LDCLLHHRQPEREERRKRGPRIDPPGFDAGKLIKGKKRHVPVDTQGLLLHGIITAADVQDRDGGLVLLATLFGLFPYLEKLFADSAYEGPIFHAALAGILPHLKTEIVKRWDRIKGFVALPKRWIVERTIAWLNRCGDWPRTGRTSTEPRSPSSSSPPSASCSENSATPDEVPGRTLSPVRTRAAREE